MTSSVKDNVDDEYARFVSKVVKTSTEWRLKRNDMRIAKKKRIADCLKTLGSKRISKVNKRKTSTTLCRKCGVSFCLKNAILCSDCVNAARVAQEDTVKGMPKTIPVLHCPGCGGYSYTGRTNFVNAPLQSTALLTFFLKRLDIRLCRTQLEFIDAQFLPAQPDSNEIRVVLLLEECRDDGMKLTRRHIVVYRVCNRRCHYCYYKDRDSQLNHKVHVRQCAGDKRSIVEFLGIISRCSVGAKRCKQVAGGMDCFFATGDDAIAFFNQLRNHLPIKSSSNLQVSEDGGSSMYAVLYPVSTRDLVFVRSSKALAALGCSGPMAVTICTRVCNTISVLDPLSLRETSVSADECWNEPESMKVYKNHWDVVEYVVLDVQVVEYGYKYSLAVAEVARVADFGMNNVKFTTRTHLGGQLEPGHHAYGYDLYTAKNSDKMLANEYKESLPDVVLIRKKYDMPRHAAATRKKRTSPEYEEFLKDLESNPEAMFNLSLNSETIADQNQQAETGPVNPDGNSDFDLEGLLADLALGDLQDVDAPGCSDNSIL